MNKFNLFAILSIAAATVSLFGGMVAPVVAQDNTTMGMDNMTNTTMGMDNMTAMQ